MHDDFKSLKQNPSQNFSKNSKVLKKKSQIISKTPKVRSKIMKCMIKKEKASYQMKNTDLKRPPFLGTSGIYVKIKSVPKYF